jgi:hypothetical protein
MAANKLPVFPSSSPPEFPTGTVFDTFSMLLAVCPLTNVLTAVGECEGALPIVFVVPPLTIVLTAIGERKGTYMHIVFLEFSYVLSAIGKRKGTSPVLIAVSYLADIFISIRRRISPLPVTLAIPVFTEKLTAIGVRLFSETIRPSCSIV